MTKNNSLKMAVLAASIALAMSATSAMAATPTATQLPGQGKVTGGALMNAGASDLANGVLAIDVTGAAVINWGKGTTSGDINNKGIAGFNVGSEATVTFTGATGVGTDAVLNIDSSGNASQIFGALTADSASVFVANANGVIVGKNATVNGSGSVGLIANTLSSTAASAFNALDEVEYAGTGGDVTVQAGANLDNVTLISGGGTVNVDVSSIGGAMVSAGLPSATAGGFAATNDQAVINLSGSNEMGAIRSAGDVNSSGDMYLGSADVAGTFTNTGTIELGSGFAIDGAFVNEKSVGTSGNASFGSLTNDGQFDAHGTVTTTNGGLTNNGQMNMSDHEVSVSGGDLKNNGQISGAFGFDVTDGNFANDGSITLATLYAGIAVYGGNFVNAGSIGSELDGAGDPTSNKFTVYVDGGSITNSGELNGFDELRTDSDSGDDYFTAGADYSITNSGTIVGEDDYIYIEANNAAEGDANDSTGSFTNTGILDLARAGEDASTSYGLNVYALNDVTLGGSVTAGGKAVSAKNPIDVVDLEAYDGVLTVTTPLAFANSNAYFTGSQVKLMANVTGVSDGEGYAIVQVDAGDMLADDYAIRVANGVTIAADSVNFAGRVEGETPNVILQGTVAGNEVEFGYQNGPRQVMPVSDVFSGPNGGIAATGDDPGVEFDFTGRVKAAPYLNDANFRYNGLPVTAVDGGLVWLYFRPMAYETNGTSNGLSAVNLLIDGTVMMDEDSDIVHSLVGPDGTAVTGVTNLPNTHLVLQSTGNISTNGDFYWPGYVYLGTIAANDDGSAAPGTLGLGMISLGGDFNNVLPGDISGAGGVHFITQFPLGLDDGDGGTYEVVTNANSWVNFGTDLLTQGYATGTLGGSFYGGTQGAGTVVNYGELDASMFHTHAPVATR